jgi:uncharacterized membrane protein YjjP (DUF1212 family)
MWNRLFGPELETQIVSRQLESDADFEQACQFMVLLATQAYRYGVSAFRVETYLKQLPAETVGLQGEIFVAPPFINFDLWRPAETQQHHFVARLPNVSYDLTKLAQIAELMDQFQAGQVSIVEAIARLKQISVLPARNKPPVVAAGYALCGAGIAVLLAAAWRDVVLAAILSLVVFAVVLQAGRSQWLAGRLNLLAAFVASLLAFTVAILIPGTNPLTVTLSAVIVLVPGLSLTMGISELAAKSVLSGLDRLIDGLLVTFALFIGSSIGASVVRALWTVPPPATAPSIPLGVTWVFAMVLMAGLALIFQVRPQDMSWVLLAGGIAYGGQLLGSQLGTWQGPFFGALGLGIYAGLLTWKKHRPSSVVMLPGIMILVPGIAAYFGLNTLQTSGIFGALPAVWNVLVQIFAIIGGLFVAASIMPQKSSL